MRKLITWIVVTIGIAALVRKLRSRGQADVGEPEAGDTQAAEHDPADELRQKLAGSREPAAEPEAPPVATFTPVEPSTPAPTAEPTIDERRADVHDEGRAAIDEMRKSAED
jgi:hypothetical protein